MNPLQNLLARAEAKVIQRSNEVVSIAKSRDHLKEVAQAAARDHRRAVGLVTRIRGVIEEAAVVLDEPKEDGELAKPDTLAQLGLRAGADDEPVLVEIPEPAAPFTPALDYPDAQPIDPPKHEEPNVAPLPLTPAMLCAIQPPVPVATPAPEKSPLPARPNAARIRALADDILAMFQKVRHGSTASLQFEAIYEETGKSAAAVDRALIDLAERKLIRRAKAAGKGHVSVFLKDAEVTA